MKSIFFVFIVIFSLTGSYAAENFFVCGKSTQEIFDSTELSTLMTEELSSEFDDALGAFAQSKCSDLKPDYCSMGACKDGWVCKANVNQCMSFPPN